MKRLSLHPVAHSGLYWCLRWARLASAIHNGPHWCLQRATLESGGAPLRALHQARFCSLIWVYNGLDM
eukprot:4943987-Lingulodinium_polyedra.AAC.1